MDSMVIWSESTLQLIVSWTESRARDAPASHESLHINVKRSETKGLFVRVKLDAREAGSRHDPSRLTRRPDQSAPCVAGSVTSS